MASARFASRLHTGVYLKIMNNMDILRHCTLCPRRCGIDRTSFLGFCKESDRVRIARADFHLWEEPPICYGNGSGAIFFSGCTLKCCFCQNHEISQEGVGYEVSISELAETMLRLQSEGACNINLVSATQFVPQVIEAIELIKSELCVPIVYNCGGYESIETIKMLQGYVDIYLPDLKYFSSELSQKYSNAKDYFEVATKAIDEMVRQVGKPEFDGDRLISGVMIRHLVLPSHRGDSIEILEYLGNKYASDEILLSIMSQYTPVWKSNLFPEINRRLTTFEYEKVLDTAQKYGFRWYIQQRSSATKDFIPKFYGEKEVHDNGIQQG